MRTRVVKAARNNQTLKSIELMKSRDVDTLIVINEDDTYAGIVTIGDLRARGRGGMEIGELITDAAPVVNVADDAQEAFDALLTSSTSYVIVLNDDNTVAGLITKTSMTRAMGEVLWGDVTS